MRERDLARAVEDWLQYQKNLGHLTWDRLNSGSLIVYAGDTKRRIGLCRPGTADYFVRHRSSMVDTSWQIAYPLSIKAKRGKQWAQRNYGV